MEANGKIVVSACLLGENCKYNGGNNYDPRVAEFIRGRGVIPVCPEVLSGMGVPRKPIEIVNGTVRDVDGRDVDGIIRQAVAQILAQLQGEPIECAVLKSRSPTCGVLQVHDGTFSGRLIDGTGVLAQALMDGGYRVLDAEALPEKQTK